MLTETDDVVELPAKCHVVLPGMPAGGNVAICVRGGQGVEITAINLGGHDEAIAVVRQFNLSLGIGADIERRMLAGCLMGWGREEVGLDPMADGLGGTQSRVLH